MLNAAFTMLSLTTLFLLVGLIKPGWVLPGMKQPTRIWVAVIALFLYMGSVTLYGEANKRIKEAQQAGTAQTAPAQRQPAK
ncbi:MAG: hypothetical protein ACU837_12440 [Gammaproteobacteria bacterium]